MVMAVLRLVSKDGVGCGVCSEGGKRGWMWWGGWWWWYWDGVAGGGRDGDEGVKR